MPRTAEDEEYKFLPIECPKCGLQGKIKISRLDQSFTCKQCKRLFHVTTDGVVLGERPPNAPTGLGESVPDQQPWLVRRIEQLPRIGKYLLGGILLLGSLYWLAGWMEPEEPLPGDLEERTVLVGKALGSGQWKTLKRLAKPGTAKELGQWYEKVRPEAWKDVTGEDTVDVKIDRIKKMLKKYEGGNTPVFDALADLEIGVLGKPEIKVHLVWSQDKFAEWWLDGEETLKSARGPKAGKGKQQPQPVQQPEVPSSY